MSFRIFASGSNGFRYSRNNCIDASDFSTIKVLATLQSMTPSPRGIVETSPELLDPPGITDLVGNIAHQEFLHIIFSAVTLIATNTSPGSGSLSVYCRRTRLLWPDNTSFASYNFSPLNSPGFEFARTVFPTLKETNFNNWGTLREIAAVLARFSNELESSSVPMLNIQIST